VYTGIFNGSGGTIDIDLTGDANLLALFGINNGAIMNLTVTGKVAAAQGAKNIRYMAAVAAYNSVYGSIEQVVSKAAVTAGDAAVYHVGGIAGFNGRAPESPRSEGNADGGSRRTWPGAGGIVGRNGEGLHGTSAQNDNNPDDTGGGGYIHQCRNEGAVTGGANKTGGIAGENAGSISECVNTGAVQCGGTGGGVGGITGSNGGGGAKGHIENCYNRGSLASRTKAVSGGITGLCGHLSTVRCCYNTGPLPQDGIRNPVIGAVGQDEEGLSDNNYTLDTVAKTSTDEELTGIIMTETQMKDPDFAYDLNDADETDGVYTAVSGDYPRLVG
jgi:hypothetical protein